MFAAVIYKASKQAGLFSIMGQLQKACVWVSAQLSFSIWAYGDPGLISPILIDRMVLFNFFLQGVGLVGLVLEIFV